MTSTQSATTAGGSLKEVRPGVWRSRVVVGYVDGNRSRPIQHTETYKGTKREAQALHAAHVARVGAGAVSTAAGTLGDYLSRWLVSRSATWKATTARRNATIVRQLPATLTATRLRDLKPADIQRYIDSLSASSTPAGVRRVHAVLSGALSDAVSGEAEGLPRNPAAARRSAGGSGIRLPVTDVPKARPPENDELNRILGQAGLIGELWADLFTFAAFAGVRRGEAAALRWGDVNGLDSVTVRHSIAAGTKATGGTWVETDTKTHQTRQVDLSQRARRVIARRREAASGPRVPDPRAFVFSEAADGSVPVHPDRISKMFAKARGAAGLPEVRLKDLRSYFVTVVGNSPAGLKTAQLMVGHRDITTTARHYAGSRADATAAGLAALDAIVEPVAELTA